MPLPLLAIASGAFKIGQKLFAGIKRRKVAKAEKRQAKADLAANSLAAFNAKASSMGLDFGGATSITQGASTLQNFLNQKNENGGVAGSPVTDGGGGFDFKKPTVIVAIVIGGFVLLKALKIIK